MYFQKLLAYNKDGSIDFLDLNKEIKINFAEKGKEVCISSFSPDILTLSYFDKHDELILVCEIIEVEIPRRTDELYAKVKIIYDANLSSVR
jgi:hypothetical protein